MTISRTNLARNEKGRLIASVLCYLLLLSIITALVISGILQTWALAVSDLGLLAHFIFICFYLVVGQPVGWGYSLIIQMSGFIFGWYGLISAEIGTLLGGVLGFYTSRYCCRDWAVRKTETFTSKTRRVVTAVREMLSKNDDGKVIIFFTALRVTPALTFGWCNGIAGALTDMNLCLLVLTLMLGNQMDLVLNHYLGLVLRQTSNAAAPSLSDFSNTSAVAFSPSSARQAANNASNIALVIQISAAVLLLFGTSLWSHYVLVKVLQETEEEKEVTARETTREKDMCTR